MASRNQEEEKTGNGRESSVVDIFDLPLSPKGAGDYSELEDKKPKLKNIGPVKPVSINDNITPNAGGIGKMFN